MEESEMIWEMAIHDWEGYGIPKKTRHGLGQRTVAIFLLLSFFLHILLLFFCKSSHYCLWAFSRALEAGAAGLEAWTGWKSLASTLRLCDNAAFYNL